MNLLINGKSFKDWTLEDLQVLIDSGDDYKENEYIDYKRNFAFLELKDKTEKEKKKKEFCNDICSFANANSGYLFFGIIEKNGIPTEIYGVDIPNGNTDKFELDRRNELRKIQPVMPDVIFHFIKVEADKFVVVLYVDKGSYTPYVCHLTDEPYYFYYRRGNEKCMMSYEELRRYFNGPFELSKAIDSFVFERVTKLRENNLKNAEIKTKGIVVLHIIPDDFQNNRTIAKMYNLVRRNIVSFPRVFDGFCYYPYMPFMDGLIFANKKYNLGITMRIYNNGIVEFCFDLDNSSWIVDKKTIIGSEDLIGKIRKAFFDYADSVDVFTSSKRVFLCVSVLDANMDGYITRYDNFAYQHSKSVDSVNICPPIEVLDVSDEQIRKEACNNMILAFCMACGIIDADKIIKQF